jgi:predicted aspartyl protease
MKHIVIGIAILLAGLASGCTTEVTADMSHAVMVAGPACSFPRVTEVKLRRDGGTWTVPATIDGKYVALVLDTGSTSVVISDLAAKAIGLPPALNGALRVSQGLGGYSVARPVQTRNFEIAGVNMRNQLVGLLPFKTRPDVAPPVVGLLGSAYLGAFDLEIDLAHDRLGLYGSRHCEQGFLPWPPPYDTLPFKLGPGDQVLLDMTLDGKKANALLDTGSTDTVVTFAGAKRLGLHVGRTGGGEVFTVGTADGHGAEFEWHDFSEMTIGQRRWTPVKLGVQVPAANTGPNGHGAGVGMEMLPDDGDFEPDVILGTDFAVQYKIWISYVTHQLFLARNPSSATAAR